jgi:adenylyl-sulfate kinase
MRVERVVRVIDTADSQPLDGADSLAHNQAGECVLLLDRAVAVDRVADVHETSRFVIVDHHQIRGGGIVREVLPAELPALATARDHLPALGASHAPGAVVWLTGLAGAGKSTIAERVVARLRAEGHRVEHLDGDSVRDLFPDVGFDRASRDAHIRRIGHLASRLEHHGVVVVASFISPYASSRRFARELCTNFVEVHVATPLEECERRDPKGLYARARRGEIRDVTGVDAVYEAPQDPELRLDTTAMSIDEAAGAVLRCFRELTAS